MMSLLFMRVVHCTGVDSATMGLCFWVCAVLMSKAGSMLGEKNWGDKNAKIASTARPDNTRTVLFLRKFWNSDSGPKPLA